MSTTNTTTGSNTSNLQFNPQAQALYNQLIGGGGNTLMGYMQSPFGNPAYTMGAAQGQAGAQQAGANNMGALAQNMLTSGLSGQAGAGFKQAQTAQTGRANQAMSSQANVQNVLGALSRQMSAAGTGLSFSPQLTGQSGKFNQTQSTGGLGQFAQLFGSGLGALLGMPGLGASTGATTSAGSIGGMAAPQLGQISSMLGGSASNAPNPITGSMFGGMGNIYGGTSTPNYGLW